MSADSRDYHLDLSTMAQKAVDEGARSARPYLSVMFACCNVYQRVYRNETGTKYAGQCPRCGKRVTFAIGTGGTESRTFIVH